jgi:hypothetical protein
MSTIVLRSVKGSPLSNTEVDANFTNLNNDKTQLGGTYSSGTANGVLFLSSSKVLTTSSALTFDGTTFAARTSTGGNVLLDSTTTGTSNLITSTLNNGNSYADLKYNALTHQWLIGSEQMRLTSTGLGIGTSSPTRKLSIGGASSAIMDFYATSYRRYAVGSEARGFVVYDDTASAYRMEIDSSGNLGLGVTPSAWASSYRAFDVSSTASLTGNTGGSAFLVNNAYNDGSWKYKTSTASIGTQLFGANPNGSGGFAWFQAASGTAGNAISFTQAMTLDASGNLGVGTTSPVSKLHIESTSAESFQIGYSSTKRARFGTTSSGDLQIYAYDSAGVYRNILLAIDVGTSGGNVGIGTNSPTAKLTVAGNIASTAAIQINAPSGNDFLNSSSSGNVRLGWGTYGLSGGPILGTDGAYPLIFAPNQTERARIDSSGNLLVGTTSGSGRATITAGSTQNGLAVIVPTVDYFGAVIHNQATSGTNCFIAFGTEASFSTRGTITYNRGAGLTAYNTTSDYRAKDIIGPVVDSGALIDSVPVYMGKMKGATQERPMFIAHETPDYAHTGEKDAVDADGNPVYQQMDASALIPVMWAEIQSLRARLAAANI